MLPWAPWGLCVVHIRCHFSQPAIASQILYIFQIPQLPLQQFLSLSNPSPVSQRTFSVLKNLRDEMSHQIIQDILLMLRSVTISICKTHLSHHAKYSQVPRIKAWTFGCSQGSILPQWLKDLLFSVENTHMKVEITGGDWEPGHMAQGRENHKHLVTCYRKRREKLCLKTRCLRVFQTRKGIKELLGAPRKEERSRSLMETVQQDWNTEKFLGGVEEWEKYIQRGNSNNECWFLGIKKWKLVKQLPS